MRDRDDESRRQIARRQTRRAGDRSAKIAHQLMELPPAAIGRLGLDDELRDVVDRARAVTSHIARRREERTLAGALRRVDLVELAERLDRLEQGGGTDARQFQRAEAWRTRLLEQPAAEAEFVAAFPQAAAEPGFARALRDARSERSTGRPRGAARQLFRQIVAAMTVPLPEPADDED